MKISPLALGAKKVIDAAWLHGDAYDLSSQAAYALESAQLLQSPETAAELEKLRSQVAELEAQRERRRVRLVDLQNDALNVRGALSPMGEARKVPFPLGPTLLPAVEWLIARVAELELERHEMNESLDGAVQELRANAGLALPWAASMDDGDLSMFLDDMVSAAMGRWRSDPEVPDRTVLADIEKVCVDWRTPGEGFRSDADEEAAPVPSDRPVNELTAASLREDDVTPQVEKLRSLLAGQRAVLEDPHDSPLHRSYTTSHDLDLPGAGGR